MTSIAELTLDAIRADGEAFDLHISVGAPFASERFDGWECSLTLRPLFEAPLDVAGEDSLQALALALRTARDLLEDFTDKGGRLLIDGEVFPINAWFGMPERTA
jgi:hypothetical protein|tara:strand:+ start:230 stop:541 length:312 start_codon:yes stop_codon:yes gene_type:complete